MASLPQDVHSTDAFGTAGGKALSAALEKLGTPAVLDQGYANQSQDYADFDRGSPRVGGGDDIGRSDARSQTGRKFASCQSHSILPGTVLFRRLFIGFSRYARKTCGAIRVLTNSCILVN
jgi:hypothetical protein